MKRCMIWSFHQRVMPISLTSAQADERKQQNRKSYYRIFATCKAAPLCQQAFNAGLTILPPTHLCQEGF